MTGHDANVIDIATLRSRRLRLAPALRPRSSDMRTFPRRQVNDRLFLQVVVCVPDARLVSLTLSGVASDMSASGIRVRCPRALPIGSLVDLWIDVEGHIGKFFLAGEVRWTDLEGEGHIIGVELRQGAATDIAEWRAFNIEALVQRR